MVALSRTLKKSIARWLRETDRGRNEREREGELEIEGSKREIFFFSLSLSDLIGPSGAGASVQ